MDLLNTILNSMDAPPPANEQQKIQRRRQKEVVERIRNREKEELLRFRKFVEGRIGRFAKDDRSHIEFQALDKVHRSIIHEVAEFGGFIAMSFGREDIDRYSVVYKKENAPTEDEVNARRNGDGWNPKIAKEYADRRRQSQVPHDNEQRKHSQCNGQSNASSSGGGGGGGKNCSSATHDARTTTSSEKTKVEPTSNYKDKYAHLIGQSAALEAARKTETNQSYGFVPSKNKKDMRSIEQTLADIQAKKRLRLQQQQQQQQEQEQQQQLLENSKCTDESPQQIASTTPATVAVFSSSNDNNTSSNSNNIQNEQQQQKQQNRATN